MLRRHVLLVLCNALAWQGCTTASTDGPNEDPHGGTQSAEASTTDGPNDSPNVTVGGAGDTGGAPGGDGDGEPGDDSGGEPGDDSGGSTLADLCAREGVLVCHGFDSESEANAIGQIAAGTATTATIDTQTKLEGDGSIRFDVPGMSGSNAAGGWNVTFEPTGAGQDLYIHYAIRANQGYVDLMNNLGSTGAKQFILWEKYSSCASMEISLSTLYRRGYPWPYMACGARGFAIDLPPSDQLLLQGQTEDSGYNCHYQQDNNTGLGCPFYEADVWWRYYMKIHMVTLGNLEQCDNVVEAWWKKGDGSWEQTLNRQRVCIPYNQSPQDAFQSFMLTTYMTAKPNDYPHETATAWYDNLVISRQPIIDGIDLPPDPNWPPE